MSKSKSISGQHCTYLFFGYGSEYSLHDLCLYMIAQGDPCVEIDMLHHPDVVGALRALEGKRLVFITSAHPLYDDQNFFYYKTHRKIISALHVISTLKPVAAVYYPHDLKDPVKDEEIPYLPLFDLFLSPLPELQALEEYLPVKQVGWIKRLRKTKRVMPKSFNPGGAVFFVGANQYYITNGMDLFYLTYKPLFDAGVAVKLARWHENERFESLLRLHGVKVYPSAANSVHVMEENEVIYSEALSSVVIEACRLGKKVCYIQNDTFDYRDPKREFDGVGKITWAKSPQQAARLRAGAMRSNEQSMNYFDMEGARAGILDVASTRERTQG